MGGVSQVGEKIFELGYNKDPIFYFRGFRRCGARDNGMKLLNFRYSKICSSRSCARNRAGLRNLPIKVFEIYRRSQKFLLSALRADPLQCKRQFLA